MSSELIDVLSKIAASLDKGNRVEAQKVKELKESNSIQKLQLEELKTISSAVNALDVDGIVIHAERGGLLIRD